MSYVYRMNVLLVKINYINFKTALLLIQLLSETWDMQYFWIAVTKHSTVLKCIHLPNPVCAVETWQSIKRHFKACSNFVFFILNTFEQLLCNNSTNSTLMTICLKPCIFVFTTSFRISRNQRKLCIPCTQYWTEQEIKDGYNIFSL